MKKFMLWLGRDVSQRNFAYGAGITFVFGMLYPISILMTIPAPRSWDFIKHNPNYCIYYLTFFPVAVGIIAAMLTQAHHSGKLPSQWKWAWVPFLLLVVLAVYPDALDKGVPISPVQIRFASEMQRNAVLATDEKLRDEYWEFISEKKRKTALATDEKPKDESSKQPVKVVRPVSPREIYIRDIAAELGLNATSVNRFSDLPDFLVRASVTAFVDTLLTTLAGFVILLFVLFLLYLLFIRKSLKASDNFKDQMLLVFTLLVTWFPFRVYAIWYQNFYSFENAIADGITVAAIVGLLGGLMLIVLFRRGHMPAILTAALSMASGGVAAIAKLKPELLEPVGIYMNHMSLSAFIVMEVVVIATLLAIVWPYLSITATDKL